MTGRLPAARITTAPARRPESSPSRRRALTPIRPSLLRHPDFLKLWSADSISKAGTQVSVLAIPLVAVLILGASAFEVALLGTIEFLPFILFTLPAGVWVDRLRRRPILITGDVVRAVSLASIPVAYQLGVLSIYQLYLVGFINGIATVFFDVADQSYLPAIIDRDQLVEGNSKLEVSRSGAQILGPGIAGILVQAVTAPIAIIVDSLSYVGSALILFLIRRHEPMPEPHVDEQGQPGGGMRKEAVAGLRYVLGHPFLRSIAAATSVSNLFSQFIFAILIVYLVRDLGLTPAVIGLIFSIGAVGFLGGALIANRIAARIGVGPTVIAAMAANGPGNMLIAIAPREFAVPFLVAGILIGGASGVIYNINQVSLRQAITPERMQGRMNATMRFLVWGTIPIGAVVGGVLATAIGIRETLLIGGLGGFVPFLFLLFSPVRSIQKMPEPVDATPAKASAEQRPGESDDGVLPLGHQPLARPEGE
jgi:MFS family permease